MPANPLHTCKDVLEAMKIIDEARENGRVYTLVNEKNEKGEAPIHALMRSGPKAKEVVKFLIQQPEVDVNAIENKTGVTIAHLCEDGALMRLLIAERDDFNPNVKNPFTGQTALIYGITYPKHEDLTRALLTHKSLEIDENEIKTLLKFCTKPKSIAALNLVTKEIQARKDAVMPAFLTRFDQMLIDDENNPFDALPKLTEESGNAVQTKEETANAQQMPKKSYNPFE